MPTTGSQFYKQFMDAIDMPYDGYIDTFRATRLAKDALTRIVELKYSGLATEKQYDELSNLLLLDEVRVVRNNRLRTSPLPLTNVTLGGLIQTAQPHQLQVGDTITLSGLQGFTPSLDGTYTVVTVPSTTQVTVAFPVVAGLWVSGSGSATTAYMYADMLHPMAIRTTFVDKDAYSISAATSGSAPYIAFNRPNTLREGNLVRINGVTGLSGLQGDFYIQRRGLNSFFVYTDADMTVVPTVTGTYAGGGTAKLIITETCEKLISDRRISHSYTPTVWRPKFGTDDNGINLFPTDRVCESASCDYMRVPQVLIDCANTSIDLELYYTFRLLMRIRDEMVKEYYERMREDNATQIASIDEQQNP